MNAYRINRLFHPDSGRCLAIAVDHGMPGEADLLEGIEDMEAVIDALVAADPEALLLTPGQADLLQRRVGRAKPALVLRVDTGNVFGREVPDRPASWMYDDPVGIAVRLDAACVIANLQDSPGQPSLRETCVQNILRLRGECNRADMPLMVEPVPMAPNTAGYDVHRDAERLRGLVRQGPSWAPTSSSATRCPTRPTSPASCAPRACPCSSAAAGASPTTRSCASRPTSSRRAPPASSTGATSSSTTTRRR